MNKKKIATYLVIFLVVGVVGVIAYAIKEYTGKLTDEDYQKLLNALKNPDLQNRYDYLTVEELKQKDLSKSDVNKLTEIANQGASASEEDVNFAVSKLR